MNVSVVIPARRGGSQRLPGKMLADLNGKPLLWHTWSRVSQMSRASEVFIAVDDQLVFDTVSSWGGKPIMTDSACCCGTERIASILPNLSGDFILNVQGDECFIDPLLLDSLVDHWQSTSADIVTPVYRIRSQDQLIDPNVVKVVLAADGRALYFSRSPVPYLRDVPAERWVDNYNFWWHIGVYGFSRHLLENYLHLPPSSIENVEKLEQLRFLEAGYKIYTLETHNHSVDVNSQADLDKARNLLLTKP